MTFRNLLVLIVRYILSKVTPKTTAGDSDKRIALSEQISSAIEKIAGGEATTQSYPDEIIELWTSDDIAAIMQGLGIKRLFDKRLLIDYEFCKAIGNDNIPIYVTNIARIRDFIEWLEEGNSSNVVNLAM